MKTLRFNELLVASFRDKRARRIRFDPTVTVIRGDNETGKSVLIKSLLRTFGAEPAKVHPTWLAADIRSLVRFELDGVPGCMLRHGNSFACFDDRGSLIGKFTHVTKQLAPFLSKLFAFGLRLPARNGPFVPLPPAYFFLPFYMDQDASWVGQWTAFANLAQFTNWRQGVVEYHAGIRGNEYYEAQALKYDAENDAKKVRRRREGLEEVYAGLARRYGAAQFNVDFSAYQQDIDELLKQCQTLDAAEQRYKARVTELRNDRQTLQTQLDITEHARAESRRDYDHANADLGDEVGCPICGSVFANSFAERFRIAVDEDHCAELMVRLYEDVSLIDERIEEETLHAEQARTALVDLERLLAKREGAVELGDLIKQEGRKELRALMLEDLDKLRAEEGRLHLVETDAVAAMKRLDSKERRAEVNNYYRDKMQLFLMQLDVHSGTDAMTAKVDATIRDTGSELPRALLAYQMAFLHVAAKFGSSTMAPVVIDSPNQQEQDSQHLTRVLQFIREQRPKSSQLILALVNSAGVDFGGTEIVLDRKRGVLLEDQYADVGGEIQKLVDIALDG